MARDASRDQRSLALSPNLWRHYIQDGADNDHKGYDAGDNGRYDASGAIGAVIADEACPCHVVLGADRVIYEILQRESAFGCEVQQAFRSGGFHHTFYLLYTLVKKNVSSGSSVCRFIFLKLVYLSIA